VAKNGVAVAAKYGNLVAMTEKPLSALMIKHHDKVCLISVVSYGHGGASLAKRLNNFSSLGPSATLDCASEMLRASSKSPGHLPGLTVGYVNADFCIGRL